MTGLPKARAEADPTPAGGAVGIPLPFIRLRRLVFLGLVAGTTGVGATMMARVLTLEGPAALELLILVLFTVTFCWITMAFWTAAVGFLLLAFGRDPLTLRAEPETGRSALTRSADGGAMSSRVALVMPVHNEDPSRVVRGFGAVLRSLARAGHAHRFDAFLLSDTTDPAIARAEEHAWARMRNAVDVPSGLFYRRRPSNAGRKAGNIADFCRRWGVRYDFMVVLDADSVMEGEALLELVRAMEADPEIGLIQTLPVPVHQATLFGRIMQFTRWMYGPMVATGMSFWQTDAGSYWGHNAIVRVAPFMAHCGLPVLPGEPPLGGEILSHDSVEAALLRRAGWKVFLVPSIGGSYEEVPGNILDHARRDRRWTEGNLQHLRLLRAPGFHWVSRFQLFIGAMSYLTSPLWLAMLLASTLYAVLSHGAERSPLPGGAVLTGANGAAPGAVVPLLAMVLVILFAPKVLALLLVVSRRAADFGGTLRLVVSAFLEMIGAIVLAPLMMMYHSQFVIGILRGRSTGWATQGRESRTVSWEEAWQRTRGSTLLGIGWGAVALLQSVTLFLWLTPILTGLVLAAPLVRLTSGSSAGEWALRQGLFLVPPETAMPRVLAEASMRATRETSVAAAPRGESRHMPPARHAGTRRLPPERPRAMPLQPLLRGSWRGVVRRVSE